MYNLIQNDSSKILFISPEAFGYYKHIINSLEKTGYKVSWLNQIPSNNVFIKALCRLFPNLATLIGDVYFKRSIKWQENYDYVIIIKGEAVSLKTLKKMRKKFFSSKFIFYNWDSFKNSKDAIKKLKYFDKKYSFDLSDCEAIKNVKHLPLFYTNDYKATETEKKKKYVGLFVGTIHSNRYDLIEKIADIIEKISNKKVYKYYFYANKLIFIILKLFKKDFVNVDINQINFKTITSNEVSSKIEESLILIDICHTNQSGLTMRTIESIGMKCKLITNNQNILKYDFYKTENIHVINENDIEVPKSFVLSPYVELPPDVYNKYSLEQWVMELLRMDDVK